MRLIIWIIFWFLYFPLVRLLTLLMFWNARVESRELFEKRNKFESLSQSFKDKNMKADLCFQFSSEGEYQQVAPLIDDAIKKGKLVEMVFFSPSVEKAVRELAYKYPAQARYLRYPLVRIFPFVGRRSFTHWVTSKVVIMVRYDLFPEFLLWGMKEEHDLRFVWMTFKKERIQGKGPSFWKKLFLKNSSTVFYASDFDRNEGARLQVPGLDYDFRMEQIRRRMHNREQKFAKVFPLHKDFKKIIDSYPREKTLILGNTWPSDLFLLNSLPQDFLVVIVPHQLSDAVLKATRDFMQSTRRGFTEINESSQKIDSVNTILVNQKGILCELYADFGNAYVGGGFEGSIHSVLEPLVAGSDKISCGPAHHRSTEYDITVLLEKMTEVNTPEQFNLWLNSPPKKAGHDKINQIMQGYESAREKIISC